MSHQDCRYTQILTNFRQTSWYEASTMVEKAYHVEKTKKSIQRVTSYCHSLELMRINLFIVGKWVAKTRHVVQSEKHFLVF
jgi:hypothetical protein